MKCRSVHREPWFCATVLFGAFVLTWFASADYMRSGPPLGDDNSAHLALCNHIARLLSEGTSDFFWEHSNLGLPLFAAYQPLPSLLTGFLMFALPMVAPTSLFKAVLVTLWATMPTAWYIGARWAGASRPQALLIGLFTLATREQWHLGLTLTSTAHTGLFTQLWGLWLFPLAVGGFERSVFHRTLAWPWAAILMSLTVMSHLFVGTLAALAFVCLHVTRPTQSLKAWKRSLLIAAASFGLCAFWLVPLVMTRTYLGGLPWMNDNYDGWSLIESVRALTSGSLLDDERFPWLTILALGGCFDALRHSSSCQLTRATALFGILSLALLGGREVWGDFYFWVPMHANVNPTRYIIALQAVGVIAASHFSVKWLTRFRTGLRTRTLVIPLCIGLVCGLLWGHYEHAREVLRSFPLEASNLPRVAGELADDRLHRFMVHSDFGTGNHFHRDLLPMLADRPQLQSYALGFHATVSTYYAEHIALERESLRLFNVNTLVSRTRAPVPNAFVFYRGIGEYTLHRVADSEHWGYFDMVWPGPRARGSLRALRAPLREHAPRLFANHEVIPLDILPDSEPYIESYNLHPRLSAGQVLRTEHRLTTFRATVDAEPGAWLLFKMNYFPFWHAYVNGVQTPIEHVAPNFMAVALPGGPHEVEFRYENPPLQKISALFSFSLLLLWLLFASITYHREARRPKPTHTKKGSS